MQAVLLRFTVHLPWQQASSSTRHALDASGACMSRFHSEVCAALESLGVPFQVEAPSADGLFSLDILAQASYSVCILHIDCVCSAQQSLRLIWMRGDQR